MRLVAAVYSEARTKGVSHSASGLQEAASLPISTLVQYAIHTFKLMIIGEYEDNHFNLK